MPWLLILLESEPAQNPGHNTSGTITLRYAGRLRHLGIGRAHAGTTVLMLIRDTEVVTSNTTTGEVITRHLINPDKDYQAPIR